MVSISVFLGIFPFDPPPSPRWSPPPPNHLTGINEQIHTAFDQWRVISMHQNDHQEAQDVIKTTSWLLLPIQ